MQRFFHIKCSFKIFFLPFFLQIVGDRIIIAPGSPDRPTSSSKTLKESTNKNLPFVTTENATTELIENGTFHENHLSTSATKNGPNKVAIFLPTAFIIIVIIVGAGMGLRVNRSSTKKTQTVSDEETQLQVLHTCIYNNYKRSLKLFKSLICTGKFNFNNVSLFICACV